ncbi:PEP-CTERM sorting domain-containing protein [Pseudorhodoferax sp.]|uniref:PEP-CTERM sorting domain-containing protein n=1 Tax=Pseudorhodoferax sp. TaxID=1993553 RepID=UPI002DD67E40|nr:PEP-CTERM sorting domain-containing protein [Pseudorhodoferax sp.]
MQIKSITLGAALALSAAVSAHAQTATTTWSNWSAAGQPGYSGATGIGTFAADAGSEFGATLSINNAGKAYGGLYTDFYYTGAADADLQLSSALAGDGVSDIALTIAFGGWTFTSLPTLTIDGQTYAFDAVQSSPDGDLLGYPVNSNTYTWHLDETGPYASGTAFTIAWTFDQHVAFSEVAVSQVTAVPEPETYALMMAGLLTVVGSVRRQRRRELAD